MKRKSVAEFRHAQAYPVTWLWDGAQHRIVYGKQTRDYYCSIEAGHEYGECVRHALECAEVFSL